MVAMAAAGVMFTAGPGLAHSDPAGTPSSDGAIDNPQATHGHDAQHDGEGGHLPAVDENVDVVSKLDLGVEPGKIADVAVYGNHAYLAAWGGVGCERTGFYVADISDVAEPEQVAFIPAPPGSYPGEGMHVIPIESKQFRGDVLVTNNEICGPGGVGGINVYDVSDPANPLPLALGVGDVDKGETVAHQTHSVFAWSDGSNAYAAMVDNEEAADVDILDITDPRKPKLVAEHDLAALFPEILQPGRDLDEVFLHDLVVEEIDGRYVMLASYWDAGYVQLDVTKPHKPRYLSDSDFAELDPEAAESGLQVRPEGNAHQAEFTRDDRFVLAADEDFSPYALVGRNETDGSEVSASQGSGTPKLEPGQTISGQSVFAGLACSTSSAVPEGDGDDIAVVERGGCTFTEKVASVQAATGYRAVLVFNREGSDGCNASLGMSVEGGIPAFGVAPRQQGYDLFDAPFDEAACLAGDGTATAPITLGARGDTLTFRSYFDGWGYVHLLDGRSMTELDTYAIDEAHDLAFATGSGDLSVHEVAVSQRDENLAYLSYYAGGVRVIDVSNGEIEEVGAFIGEGGNNFWGVETFMRDGEEYAALSDRDFGLYIVKYAP
jgi:hypothetical protein